MIGYRDIRKVIQLLLTTVFIVYSSAVLSTLVISEYNRKTILVMFSYPIDRKKIITVPGVRRCGKSALLLLAINKLLSEGTSREHILFLNFDDERLPFSADNLDEILQAYRELYPHIPLRDVYMFFDEIQMAQDWEQFVRRVYELECKHIFLTGSNSRMLSSELSTSLRGRTLQYEEFTLSFTEYCRFIGTNVNPHSSTGQATLINAFQSYLVNGGFPEVTLAPPLYKKPPARRKRFIRRYLILKEK